MMKHLLLYYTKIIRSWELKRLVGYNCCMPISRSVMPAKAPTSLVDKLVLQVRLGARRLLPEFAQLSVQQCTPKVIRQGSDALDPVVSLAVPHRRQAQVEAMKREPVETDSLPPVPIDARVPVLGIPNDWTVESFFQMFSYLMTSSGSRPAEEQAERLVCVWRRSAGVTLVVLSMHIERRQEE